MELLVLEIVKKCWGFSVDSILCRRKIVSVSIMVVKGHSV